MTLRIGQFGSDLGLIESCNTGVDSNQERSRLNESGMKISMVCKVKVLLKLFFSKRFLYYTSMLKGKNLIEILKEEFKGLLS